MDYEQVFTKFNVGTARQVCLNAEVRMQTEYCLSERKRLELMCVNQANLLKAKNDEIERLKAQLLLKEAVAVETTSSFSEYLTALGAAISRAIEKGMQDGLAARIEHDREGGSLIDVATYNPSAEADFIYALQELREIDFLLLAELKSHKDASVEDIMNLLRLEGPLIDAPGMGDLQHDIEQLKVPIHKFTTPERDLLS
nr:hypothetical protein [Tanacetum cinerariifolium]